jgi:pimeloyl-ACP methyl ester carboxylesterase
MKRILIFVLAALLGTLALPTLAQDDLPRFEAGRCPFTIPAGADVECGTVFVPEDYANPDPADVVGLAVAIYRSSAASPAADPVIFLQGGPGGGAIQIIPFTYETLVLPITATRDFIVFDQRGTGFSTPALNCPEYNELVLESLRENYSVEESLPLSRQVVDACGDRLDDEGVNLAAYTSAASAADIAALSSVLGYEQVNLYGGSYGTRLALTVMRDTPDLVRAVVLDGVLGVEENQIGIVASKSDWALKALFTACAADDACNAAYPDLENTFWDTVDSLNETPAPVTITIPTTGEQIETLIDGITLISGVFFALQTGGANAPAIIQAAADGDFKPLEAFLVLPVLLGDLINIGAFYSVMCTEEIPAITPAALDAEIAAYPRTGELLLASSFGGGEAIAETCANWADVTFDPIEAEPVVSDIPALLFSGEFDPATPPYFAERVAENLSNSYNLLIPGAGHVTSISNPCAMGIVTAFLDDPASAPDSACLAETEFAFTTPDSEISVVLVELVNDQFGYTSLIPEGWSEISIGTYAEGMTATTAIVQLAVPNSNIASMQQLLGGQFNIDEFPEPTTTVDANGLTWELYEVEVVGQSGDLALAEDDNGAYVILLISTPIDRDANYEAIFLPIVEAFVPNN